MEKPASYLAILALLGSVIITGCMNNQNFEVHEWGVFVKGYDCSNTSVLGKPPNIIYVKKPVIYFHNLKDQTNVMVKVDSVRNANTTPSAYTVNNHILWNVKVENDRIFSHGVEYPYLFYEGEINYPTNVDAEITLFGGNITFYVKNNENYTITDIYLIYGYPTGNISYLHRGLTYARIDRLESGEERVISTRLRNSTSYELEEFTTSLIEKGLAADEAQELIEYWRNWWFYPSNIGAYSRLIYAIPQNVYDEILPLSVLPVPASTTRVGIVTLTDIPTQVFSNLSLILSTDKHLCHVNDSINVSLRLINNGDGDVVFTFPDAQIADFEVMNEAGEQVYLWSSEKMFAQVITNLTVPAGESMELLNETWTANVGNGKYTITGWLMTKPRIYSNSVDITISQ